MFGRFDRVLALVAPWRAGSISGARGMRRGHTGGGGAIARALPPPVVVHDDGDDLADGVWPEDVDATPAWLARQLARAGDRGIVVPQIRSRRDLDAAIERCRLAIAPPVPVAVETEPLPELGGAESAERFLAHLRETATVSVPQRFTSEGLAARYSDWCGDGHPGAPENVMRGALKQLPGVSRSQESDKVDGRRVRSYVWTVYPLNRPETQAAKGKSSIVSAERVAA